MMGPLLLFAFNAVGTTKIYCFRQKNPNKANQTTTATPNKTKKMLWIFFSSGNVHLQLKLIAMIKHQHFASIIWALHIRKEKH